MQFRKSASLLYSICLLAGVGSFSAWAADPAETPSDKTTTSVKVNNIPTSEDTSVIIKKGSGSGGPEFEILSGDGEVLGDPKAGVQESYASWKEACQNWKKETKELNKDNQILVLNCNAPTVTKEAGGMQSYHSSGTYKMKVRIKSAK